MMALKIVDIEELIQPVPYMENVSMEWITIGDRVANATPWQAKKGENDMAFQKIIQSFLIPDGMSAEKLEELLDPENFAKFVAEKTEPYKGGVKYIQLPEEAFESELQAAPLLGSEIHAIYGTLRDAQKADMAIPMPGAMMAAPVAAESRTVSFEDMLYEKMDALRHSIRSSWELQADPSKAAKESVSAANAFAAWLKQATQAVADQISNKSDEDEKPKSIVQKLIGRREPPAIKTAIPPIEADLQGEIAMSTEIDVQKIVQESVAAQMGEAIKTMGGEMAAAVKTELDTRAQTEEARKADEAAIAEKKALIDKVTALEAQIAKLSEGQAGAQKTEEEQKAELQANFTALAEKVESLGTEISAWANSAGIPASGVEDPQKQTARKDEGHPMAGMFSGWAQARTRTQTQ